MPNNTEKLIGWREGGYFETYFEHQDLEILDFKDSSDENDEKFKINRLHVTDAGN